MIHVEEALSILAENTIKLQTEIRNLNDALGLVLAEDVYAISDFPDFDQSAMDGVAINYSARLKNYEIIGEVAAGSSFEPTLNVGQGVKIFTGAKVPNDATTVVPIELYETEENQISIPNDFGNNKNIRPRGEQIRVGELALEKGSEITPAAIGFLTTLGINEIKVIQPPNVSVIVTGNELVKPGESLLPGQIYESNSAMLLAVLKQKGIDKVDVHSVPDNYEATKSIIVHAIEKSNLVVLSGGISVGDYDFVGKALNEIGVNQLFYKVKQKPGKPLYAGKLGKKMILALPGNPAATLTCFYVYGTLVLNKMQGLLNSELGDNQLSIATDFENKSDRAVFLKAKIINGKVVILDKQSSAMLGSFAKADVLVYIDAKTKTVKENQLVTVFTL